MQRFLTFCVEAALRGEAPKEYVVGTAVFDRKDGYDPRVDPIVRVEARRLREKLEQYYSQAGVADEVIIQLPKGSYTPLVERRGASSASQPRARPAAIAVLPFSNLSKDPEDDYFSDGLTEELIHRLTRVEGLRVLAWPSASRLRGWDDDSAIRSKLDIDFVLRGSVRRGAGGVRITAQLVDAATGEFRWSEGYSRALSDLLLLQEEIAGSIVSTLRLTLRGPSTSATPNAESHNLCMKGRFLAGRRTVEAIRKSIACYEDAAAADPRNAVAFAGLADGLSLLAEYADVPPSATMERAREYALRALELDPFLAEAHVSLAIIRAQFEWQWESAEALY
jgi:serine/threonine-protein kinase